MMASRESCHENDIQMDVSNIKLGIRNTGKEKRTSKWKVSHREFGQFKRKYGFYVLQKKFHDDLDNAHLYYLNEMGLTIHANRKKVEELSAQYMWAQLEGYRTQDGEPLYAWMKSDGKGGFKCIQIGPRGVFDAIIARKIASLSKDLSAKH